MKRQTISTTALARILLGLIFTVFGLNGFLGFLPTPSLNAEAGAFIGGLAASGYFFPVLKGTEIIAGLLLLSNRFVPLALTVLAPVALNILLFHLFLTPGELALPVVIVALGAYLAWQHRAAYAPLFETKKSSRAALLRPLREPAVSQA